MAVPTPTTRAWQHGTEYNLSWTATWSTTDNFADLVVVDRSALTGTVLEIEVVKLIVQCTAGIDALFEFDHSVGDQMIFQTLLGVTTPFDGSPPQGREGIRIPDVSTIIRPFGAATDGDVVLTTSSAASGDVVSFWLWAKLHF